MTTVLTIDQSTSATKALLFDADGGLIDRASVEHQQYYPQPGWVEHDADEIYRNTLTAIQTVLARNPALKDDLSFLSITNQRETIVVFDRATGQPVYNAIVWQCRRGEPLCQQLSDAGHDAEVHAVTGLKIDTYFPASKIAWLFAHVPGLQARVRAGEALIGTIDAYLIYRLTGGAVFATDPTNASRTLLFDIHNLRWSEELCDLFGVPVAALPEVRESSACFGETTLDGLLERPLPLYGVMGDSQAALFAERCWRPGLGKVTFGSGSSVLLNIGDTAVLSEGGIVTTVGWRMQGHTTYAFEGIINFTGATINWLRDQLQLISTPAETEALAQAVPDNGGVYLIPAFVGLSAPYWQPRAKAAIVGLTPAATRSHVVRAALESIAYQVKDVLDLMHAESQVSLENIHADGGMVSNAFLMQFVADMTQIVVQASDMPESSALGATLAGLLGAGVYATLDDLGTLPHRHHDYKPQRGSEYAQANYAGWQAAVQQVL
jgi:glycerol kinase